VRVQASDGLQIGKRFDKIVGVKTHSVPRTSKSGVLPASLSRFSPSWFGVIGLEILSPLAAIVATFLPMKTILILASGVVPGFFPKFMLAQGVLVTSVLLMLFAAVAGGVSWLVSKVLEKLDDRGTSSTPGDATPDWDAHDYATATLHRKTVAAFALVPVLMLVVGLTSLTFLVIAMAWVFLSFAAVLWRAPKKPASSQRLVDRVGHRLVVWFEKSSVWASVGIALVTLVVLPPALGTTGILVATIFGRRLFIGGSQVLKFQLGRPVRRSRLPNLHQTGAVPLAKRSGQTRAIDHFATEQGQLELEQLAKSRGFSPGDLRIVGDPGGPIMSVVFGVSGTSQVLLRIFPPRLRAGRNLELRRRQRAEGLGPFQVGEPEGLNVGGFPSMILEIVGDDAACSTGVPSRAEASRFQAHMELALSDSPRFADGQGLEVLQKQIMEGVEVCLRLPGSHTEACRALLEIVPEATRLAEEAPQTIAPDRGLRATDFYKTVNGDVRYLGGHAWTTVRLGQSWQDPAAFKAQLIEKLDGVVERNNRVVCSALVVAELTALSKTVDAFNFDAFGHRCSELERRVQELKEALVASGRDET